LNPVKNPMPTTAPAAPPAKRGPRPRRVPPHRQPFPHPTLPGVCLVPLLGGHFALVDAEDAERVGRFLWTWMAGTRPEDAGRAAGRGGTGRMVYLPHFVLDIAGGGLLVRHENGDGLDCRKSNLARYRTRRAKGHARKCRRPTSSRFKGVSRVGATGKWYASIRVRGRTLALGLYADELAAAKSYDAAAAEHFGEHARPNFPASSEG
jgi:hypothetical protein